MLSWNIRGLGRVDKRRAVRNLVFSIKPIVLFIQETKLKQFDSRVVKSLGGTLLSKGIRVDAVGSARGLLTLWNEKFFEVRACISNDRCLIVFGMLTKSQRVVNFCTVYADNQERGRVELWKYILEAQAALHGPWHVLYMDQQQGHHFLGKLDRFLCDPLFLSWFPGLVQKGLGKSLSDHNQVMIGEPGDNWGPRPFRFLNGWLEDKGMMEGVRES
ncbi:hypothetical protein Dsin_023863 [Dipteronia sinensis]|uniref:Endonuclease/exonuclease/phosphatase domain-containing protein n=1 Tax=Dipteronia sinensis TaxID=43782 RepID=A0AAE0A4G0_9ROSI|nr:hypothetical protein Dsin_023863 [Dipteronia sinensis]